MGRLTQMIRDIPNTIAALLYFSASAAWPAEAGGGVLPLDVPPKLRPASSELISRCMAKTAPASAAHDKVKVVATISLDGKAGNLRFPADIEPWQEETAQCVMGLLQFDPATHEGVPVAADVTVPIVLQLPAAPIVVPPRLKNRDFEGFSNCYARSARRAGAEGQIQVGVTVEPDGSVGKYELPAGIEPWQKVTAECLIPQMRFEPATRDGVPFTAMLKFPLNFSLEGLDPLTLAKLVASDDELEAAMRSCYPAGRADTASPNYRVTINVRGWPSQVVLVESSGDKKLDAVGACVLKKVRYEPAKRGERPVMSTLLVPITVRPPSSN